MWFGYQVITGLGIGVGFQVGVIVVQNVLPIEQVPVATAAIQFFQSLGGAVFIAVAQSLFQTGLISGIEADAPGIDPKVFINAGASQVLQILQQMNAQSATDAVLNAYLQGLRHTYFISVACAAAAFVVSLGLSWKTVKKDKKKTDAEASSSGADEKSGTAVDNGGVATEAQPRE
jgi:hypothetical protein